MKMKNILLVVLLVVLNIVCIQVFAIGRSSETVAPLLKPLQESTVSFEEAMVPQDTVGAPLYTMCCFWAWWWDCDTERWIKIWSCIRLPGDECFAQQTW